MENKTNLLKALEYIDPSRIDYQDWINVGMALKYEGYSVEDWDNWSRQDSGRYHPGECKSKWNSFNGSGQPVTAGTIVAMAKDNGFMSSSNEYREIDWDGVISVEEDDFLISGNNTEGVKLSEPVSFDPLSEIVTYLETLFEANENVGYVTETWQKEEDGKTKYFPTQGAYDRTAGELIECLNKCGGDIGAVLGDYNPEAGAWIRFNPLDGKGVKNENVTDYRYALVESDTMAIEQQNAVIRELELPIALLVYSGGKSLHAIVKIEASSYEEYRKRVDYLYGVCRKNGLEIDKQNKNPSRLSRLPGVMRNGKKQYIVDKNIGKDSFSEWKDWVESINDNLPNPESMADVWDNLPELSPPLIDGVLRQGHKMLIAGPSKAGKSYALIELCCAVAEGKKWLGFDCTQGRIMYVNLELDRASCFHRFKDVYTALNYDPNNLDKIDIWNLRGNSVPMDKLAPKLIRRASKKGYIAIVIDPIYKIITGDENSADQMSHFCNQFDKVCTELGCAVIYCHHHSKGSQGSKRSMDRASGSGVFARDPDALLDLSALEVTDSLKKQEENKLTCAICVKWISRFNNDFVDELSQDDLLSASTMFENARKTLSNASYKLMMKDVEDAKKKALSRTAWRIEGTLREFPKFEPINLWFDFPVHREDDTGALKDLDFEGDAPNWQKAVNNRKLNAEKKKNSDREKFESAISNSNGDNYPTLKSMSEYLNISERTTRNWIKRFGYFIDKNNGTVKKNESEKTE